MKGSVTIDLTVGNESFHVLLKRKLTILKGDSGIGKTVFHNHIRKYLENKGVSADVDLKISGCDGIYIPSYTDDDWPDKILERENYVILIDEDNKNVLKYGTIGSIIKESNNYFLIITRESIKEGESAAERHFKVDNIGQSTKAQITFEGTSNVDSNSKELFSNTSTLIYYRDTRVSFKPDLVIVEDRKSGYEFFSQTLNCEVVSAINKTRIIKVLSKRIRSGKYKNIYIIVDGENYGFEIDSLMEIKMSVQSVNIEIADIRSFEWLLLSSGKVFTEDISDICENTQNYCDVSVYNNWEKFYTALIENGCIVQLDNKVGFRKVGFNRIANYDYTKSVLNRNFLESSIVKSVYDKIGDLDESMIKFDD